MTDQFEEQARAIAHSLPICDLGSTQAIQAIAIGLRETWRMATEAASDRQAEVVSKLERTVAARDRRISRLMEAFEDARRQGIVLPGDLDPPVVLSGENLTVFHATPDPDACKHEWGGWRDFEDGRGGEQVCKTCGMGAMAYTLRTGP